MIHNIASISVAPLTPVERKLDWTHTGTEMRGEHYDMYEIAWKMVMLQGVGSIHGE